jgi:hypothetical protein
LLEFSRMKNIQHSTSNNQYPMVIHHAPRTGCSMLNGECWMISVPLIPTGLHHSAQGWPRQRTTLGQPKIFSNPNGVVSARHTALAMCLKICASRSPSRRPSPSGRGRTVCRFFKKPATGFAGYVSAKLGTPDCCSLSPGERVRVRGKQPFK